MKVLQVLYSLNVNSGVANMIMNYYRNIDREQVQFDFLVVSFPPKNYNEEVINLGGMVYKFTRPGLKTFFKSQKELDAFFKEHGNEYDIIHCHEILVAKMVFKYARKYGNVKCISHSHSVKLSDKALNSIRNRIIINGLNKKSDYCFACSKRAGQNAFGTSIVDDNKFFVLINAINLDKYKFNVSDRDAARKEFNLEDKFVIGTVGRLSNEKNQKFAINVLKSILSYKKDAVLLLVGKGEIEDELKDCAEKQGVKENVIFAGVRNDIPQILNAMDYFVFPSRFEGFGIALLEAQASGLNCLCFENMPEEVFASDKIQLMPLSSDWNQWAEKVVNTEELSNRESYSELLKTKGYGIEEQVEKLKDLYLNIKENRL